jgi:LmbE family N-acetylglucosaminyl deacetylase
MGIFGNRVLVVGAHPDDLEMNAGGTIRKLTRAGKEVHTVTLTSHFKSEARLPESMLAQKHLFVTDMHWLGGEDCKLHRDKSELIAQLDTILTQVKPDCVVTHFHADTHQDHVSAYEITVAAARKINNLLLFKPTFPSGRTDIPFHPTFVSSLEAEDMMCKVEAMREFKSQMVKYGAGDWIDALTATASGDAWTYGGFHGYAEIFQLSRAID